MAAGNGGHAEIYEDIDELLTASPAEGVLLINGNADTDGDLIARLLAADITLPVILFAEQPQPSAIVRAVHRGVVDYLVWPFSESELLDSCVFSQNFLDTRGAALARKQQARLQVEQLSKREKDVLQMLMEGHSNKSMANIFGLSPRTVEDYRFSLIQKLGVSSTSAAVRVGIEADLSEMHDSVVAFFDPRAVASR